MLITMLINYMIISFCTFCSVVTTSAYDKNYVVNFLSHYGYLEKGLLGPNQHRNEKYLKDAISDFQNFSGIAVTGIMDDKTMQTMLIPRCGVKDKVTSREINQYILKGGKWELPRLTFAILNYPKHLSKKDVYDEITLAFNIWKKYTNLIFVQRKPSKKVNLMVQFANYSHGDGNPFDGPGNVTGHAFPHNNGRRGQIHLDITEDWTINSPDGVSLYQVVAHELGHVLGIDHSMFNTSIMARTYHYNETFRTDLSQDDIQAVQAIYGVKRKSINKPDKIPRKPETPKQKVTCRKSPFQFYRYSPRIKKFLWDDYSEYEIKKELRKLETKENIGTNYIYKLSQYVLCKKVNIVD